MKSSSVFNLVEPGIRLALVVVCAVHVSCFDSQRYGSTRHVANGFRNTATSLPVEVDPAPATQTEETQIAAERIRLAVAAREQVAPWGPVRRQLSEFYKDVGRYPTTEEGLNALVNVPGYWQQRESVAWKGPYLTPAASKDPWGRVLRYRFPPRVNVGAPPDVHVNGAVLWVDSRVYRVARSPDRRLVFFFPDPVDLWSLGVDGEDATGDEIGNWDLFVSPAEVMRADSRFWSRSRMEAEEHDP
jgi:hypothetical protein